MMGEPAAAPAAFSKLLKISPNGLVCPVCDASDESGLTTLGGACKNCDRFEVDGHFGSCTQWGTCYACARVLSRPARVAAILAARAAAASLVAVEPPNAK